MRWFYLPNEGVEGDQVGPRMAFEKLHAEGVLSDYRAYSYLVRRAALPDHSTALAECAEQARSFAPDVIFMQHPRDSYPVTRDWLQRLKALPSRPRLVLYEEDPFGRWIKRMDRCMRATLAESDLCFLGGAGYVAEMARRAGARDVRYALHSYDSRRFGGPWRPTSARRLDAVMIANLTCLKRIPWLFMPGGARRKQLARLLHRHFGERFKVYGAGQGWSGEPYCAGPVAFDQQGGVVRDAWMSVNWGQFDRIPLYTSDRLPISLACGVPHITNRQPGYEFVFDAIPGLYTVDTPADALDAARHLLSLPVERRNALGAQAAEYARAHLEATVVYGDIVGVVREQLFSAQAREAAHG